MLKIILKLLLILLVTVILLLVGYQLGQKNPVTPVRPEFNATSNLPLKENTNNLSKKTGKQVDGIKEANSGNSSKPESQKTIPEAQNKTTGEPVNASPSSSPEGKSLSAKIAKRRASQEKNNGGGQKTTPPPDPNIPESDRLSYTLFIDAYLLRDKAEELVARLKYLGFSGYIVSIWDQHRQLWHGVRVGYYKDYDSANNASEIFSHKARKPSKVLALGSLESIPSELLKPITKPGKAPPGTGRSG